METRNNKLKSLETSLWEGVDKFKGNLTLVAIEKIVQGLKVTGDRLLEQ